MAEAMGSNNDGFRGAGRVAYVVKMFPRTSETFITNEVRELKRHGLDPLLISLMRPANRIFSKEAATLAESTHYLPDLTSARGHRELLSAQWFLFKRSPLRHLRLLFLVAKRFHASAWKRFFQAGSLARYCLGNRVSHIHAGFAHTPTSVALWCHRMTGIPYSFAAHAKDLYLSKPESLINKMERARFVWTCTEANGIHLRALGTSTPVHVGYHGIDLGHFTPRERGASRDGGKARILAVGRHVPKKGWADLIRAAQLMDAAGGVDFEVVFIGDGPERGRLEELTNSLGLRRRVRFLGSLDPERVREEYGKADVAVLPSVILENGDRDGVPNVLVEAMAVGVPVVSTGVSAIPELVRDRETGLLADPGSPQDLARCIEEVLSETGPAHERSVKARTVVERRFDLRGNSKPLADLLERHRGPTRCLYVSADMGVPIRGHKGASAHVRQISERFCQAGLDLRVVTPSPGPPPPHGNEFRVPIEEVPPPRWMTRLMSRVDKGRLRDVLGELRRLAHNVPMALRVGVLLKQHRPDFVYERYSLCAFATGILCRRRRIPWLLEVNAPLADEAAAYRTLRLRWLTRRLERFILRRAHHLFVVSNPLKRWAVDQGVGPRRVTVLPNGVDGARFHRRIDRLEARAEWGWGADECVAGFAGSLKPWHGVGVLLDAFREAYLENERLRLVLIGDGPERKSLEKSVRKHSLEDVVRVAGAVAQDELPRLLRASDILVAPYLPGRLFYFSPMKILEYMAVGRPVIASNIGDIPDLVDRSCGRLVRPGNEGDLVRAIAELAANAELRRTLGHEGGRRARNHDWSHRAREILTTFEELRGFREPRERLRAGYILKMFPRFSETFIVNEILELERMGTEIRVFSMKRPAGRRQESANRVRARVTILSNPGIAAVPPHARCMFRSPVRYFRCLAFAVKRGDRRALTKFVQAGMVADASVREGVQHLHAHFASGPARVAKMASMISGLDFSFTAHAKDLYWKGHRHTESHKLKKRVRLARFVVAVSQENKRFLEGLGFKIKEGRIRTIYIGIRLDDFPFRLPSRRPRSPRPLALAIGRLIEKKGFHVLVEACAILRQRGVSYRCFIAGDGPERSRLEDLILAKGLGEQVKLLGEVALARLRRRYYHRARVLAQPCVVASDGDMDGIPTVLVEAMALGVPVISTRVSGIPEAITDGENGFLTEPGDAQALAHRMEALFSDASLADEMALAARARAEQQFDQAKNAGALWKLFLRSSRGWPPRAASEDAGNDVIEGEMVIGSGEGERSASADEAARIVQPSSLPGS